MGPFALGKSFMSMETVLNITGELFIGAQRVTTADHFSAINAAVGGELTPQFCIAGRRDIDAACVLAASAFPSYAITDAPTRAAFLEAIADQILALGDALIERAHQETALPLARLIGERGRTIGQLRLFAEEVRDGGWRGVRIDPALPNRTPLPRSDIRMHKVPLGPVAGAVNVTVTLAAGLLYLSTTCTCSAVANA